MSSPPSNASAAPSSASGGTEGGAAPPRRFANAVHAVERVLSFRGPASQSPQPQQQQKARPSLGPLHLDIDRAIPLDAFGSDEFPHIDDEHLDALFPAPQFEGVRNNVRAAIEDMKLNFSLDPKLLANERSETNQGYHAIALLLSRLQVRPADGGIDGQRPGQHAGAAGEGDEGSSKDRDGTVASSSRHRVGGGNTTAPPPRSFETHDLLKAIDRKDTETILAIRDANFDLLLDLSYGGSTGKTSSAAAQAGGTSNTPLGYAIGLGKGWEGISIVLVGALSKFVNTLPDDDDDDDGANVVVQPPALAPGEGLNARHKRRPAKVELDPHTLMRLRKVRVNLKLAIDHSIFTDQTRLLASYMQVLVMSEGSQFLYASISTVQHSLLNPAGGDAVGQARSAVLQFVTDALRHKTDRVAAVKDYVSNATGDLVLMALWDLVKLSPVEMQAYNPDGGGGEVEDLGRLLPLFYFARDDRVTAAFVERTTRLDKLLDGVEAGQRVRAKRNASAWKLARSIVEALQEGSRRKSADERMQVIRSKLERRAG
ncbi:uncharacterized protein PFL1_04933 [Pseudozyma flocculosa PF-1]|uniref:Uncharacterized protein n=1 Tax=Pseudozyma flocculosa PF-1 TaxID=1277687 RepID=A0A061H5V9_9BASI|nr:uncharacterized protein PFL1_04933 [Pseudozyma flocculosa PF-1]EPQ27395.1 hypothetical protein PFL1_04933 [Pseudozyma flocculosa PF-1]